MAPRRTKYTTPERPVHSVEQKRLYANRLKKRIEELEAFDPATVQKRDGDHNVIALEAAIEDALSAAFGNNTVEYNRYRRATELDHGPRVMRVEPSFISARHGGGGHGHYNDAREAQQYISQGKQESIALLRQAVKTLEEEIEEEQELPSSAAMPASANIPNAVGSGMNFLGQCNERVTIERQDSSRHEGVRALVSGEMILIPDAKVPIESNDAILRQLPSGLVERLIVTDPNFYTQHHGIPAHYQIKYRREGQKPAENPGYNFHLSGDNSRVNINSLDKSTNTVGIRLAATLEPSRAVCSK